jgi:PAS domain S-box-containing protein
MDDVSRPVDGASLSVKAARMIALISRVNINTRLTLCFVLIIALMSVSTGILLWQSRVMRVQANRLKEMDEQFIEVQRVHALVLSFRDKSEQLVKARNLARLQQEAPALRSQLNDSLRQTQTVFRGIEPNNTLDPTILPTLETIQGLLPSQIDSLTTLVSVADWDALSQRMEQPVETLENLSAELVDTASRDLQNKRSEAAGQIERAQIRTLFILPSVGGLTIVFAALLGFGITQTITRPLRSLVDGASALASGEFSHHVPVRGRDELAHLSQVFNQTTIKLHDLYENLRRSEQELRNVINYLAEAQRLGHIGNWVFDPAKGFEYWSDELFRIYDLDPGKGPPNSEQYLALVHPEDREFMDSLMKRMLSDDSEFDVTKRIVRASGELRYVRCVGTVDSDNDTSRRIGVGIDVTDHEVLTQELRRRESALQKREHELLGIIETIPSMLWSASPAGETTHLSQRFLEYCGVPLEELINRGWERSIHPDDREQTTKAFARAISSGGSYSAIHRMRRADGEYRWHHSMGEPLRDPHGKIIQWYGLAIDIDERKRAEDHLRDTRIKLAKASRLATVAELAGSIAHELNQPLMSILANAQAAKKWMNAAPSNVIEANSSIERIIRDARAADETMQHIRALFKQESFDKKDVNIPDILREVVRVVQEDPKKRDVPIECHFEECLPVVHVDQIQIQQVFINLIVNAIEALEGQQVAPLIVLRATTDSNGMLIQVIDNGPGVDDPNRIFDAFMTTKEKGMGIGLAVSRSIVEAHGGRLWAENGKAGGATFNMALPLTHTCRLSLQTQECA